MKKVRVISSFRSADLEKQINDCIKKETKYKLVDIKYSESQERSVHYSALLIFKQIGI